jgi:TetR/AcrR family transcriptional regulator
MTATPTRMAARMTGNDRRNQLIEVAIDLFSRKGFGGTTTKEIAAAAGVTEAIIFRHFATKQDLYKAILDSRCSSSNATDWFSEAQQFMDANDDEGLFRALITVIIQCKREDARFERLMLHAALEGHELAKMHHNQCARPFGAQLVEYVARRQQEGAIRQIDPNAVIFAVAGIAQFYAEQKYLHQCADIPIADEAVIEAFLAILMKGIK